MQLRRTLIGLFMLAVATACTPEEMDFWGSAHPEDQRRVTIDLIHQAADEFGVDRGLMVRIADCESTLRWWALNRQSNASGLFQHLPQYWPGRAEAVGMPGAWIMDPRTNARAAAWMLSTQGTRPWYSSIGCWWR